MSASSVQGIPPVGSAEEEQRYIKRRCSAQLDFPVCLIYRYSAPAIITGRSQRHDDRQMARAGRLTVPIVRRKSGGGAVMAGPGMLSTTVFLPPEHAISKASTVAAYVWMGAVWKNVLEEHHIASYFPGAQEISASQKNAADLGTSWACFSSVSHGELLTEDGRKLLGIAQIRNRYCTVLTSGIYLERPNWSVLSAVMGGRHTNVATLKAYNADLHTLTATPVSVLANAIPKQFEQNFSKELQRTNDDITMDYMPD